MPLPSVQLLVRPVLTSSSIMSLALRTYFVGADSIVMQVSCLAEEEKEGEEEREEEKEENKTRRTDNDTSNEYVFFLLLKITPNYPKFYFL